jgi:hypothetical protein
VKAFNRKIRKERTAKDAKKSASPQSTEGTDEKQIAYRVETPCSDCAGVGVQGVPFDFAQGKLSAPFAFASFRSG